LWKSCESICGIGFQRFQPFENPETNDRLQALEPSPHFPGATWNQVE
jgi:hypothetical protein